MKKIVLFPDKVLRVKTKEIAMVTPELVVQIEEVRKVLNSKEDTAAGLAATQLGFESRFFAQKEKKEMVVYINPKILKTYGEKTYPMMVFEDESSENFLEGCLSFPNLFGTVKRYLKIEVEWQEIVDRKPATAGRLETRNKILEGFEAIVFQHEAEHLDGILFVDHIKQEKGEIFRFIGNRKKTIKIEDIL